MSAAIDGPKTPDTTEDDSRTRRRPSRHFSHPLWTLVLESERPIAGSLRIDLAGLSELVVGRGPERHLSHQGGGASLTIPDRWMSTAHLRLRISNDQAEIEDAGSKNGTFVNGRPVERATLVDGDVVQIGRSFAVFRAPLPLPVESVDDPPPLPEKLRTFHPGLDSGVRRLCRIASSTVPVLLLGETGTGKEVAAGEVHRVSGRPGPLVPVNCPAIPASLVESELFGYRKGAFTGAVDDRVGLVRSADRGTLFLDEIGELPGAAQAALLRTLQESEVLPVGGARAVKVDVRIIAATHRDVDALVRDGVFRADLLARLSGFRLTLPPLRERREDLGLLVAATLRRHAAEEAASVRFEVEAARALFLHDWPLNIRELDRCLSAALVLAAGHPIAASHLHDAVSAALELKPQSANPGKLDADEQQHRDQLLVLLREHGGNITAVARAVGKARTQIQRWLRRYSINPRDFRM